MQGALASASSRSMTGVTTSRGSFSGREESATREAKKASSASGMGASVSTDKTPHSKRRVFFWSGKIESDFISLPLISTKKNPLAEEQTAAHTADLPEKPVRLAPRREGGEIRGEVEQRGEETPDERFAARGEKQQSAQLQKQGNRGIGEIVETLVDDLGGIGVQQLREGFHRIGETENQSVEKLGSAGSVQSLQHAEGQFEERRFAAPWTL